MNRDSNASWNVSATGDRFGMAISTSDSNTDALNLRFAQEEKLGQHGVRVRTVGAPRAAHRAPPQRMASQSRKFAHTHERQRAFGLVEVIAEPLLFDRIDTHLRRATPGRHLCDFRASPDEACSTQAVARHRKRRRARRFHGTSDKRGISRRPKRDSSLANPASSKSSSVVIAAATPERHQPGSSE